MISRFLLACVWAVAAFAADRPVFRVDVPYPTKDKPQSKLWFAHGSWWAWLPVQGGSSVWRRTGSGWVRQTELDQPLRGLPGQADVWADDDSVRAVLVEPIRVAVVSLQWDGQRYRISLPAFQFVMRKSSPKDAGIETATIARDGRGRWWIAYNWQRDMWIRTASADGREFSVTFAVSESPASSDDICAVVALPGKVGVVWSDQASDSVYFRWHSDGAPPEQWSAPEIADKGNGTADDHIHTVVSASGTLYVATKNSVDTIGKPQLVLRVRDPQGKWRNLGYATRTAALQPSRPIALLGGTPERLFLLHSLYRMDRPTPPQSTIAWQSTDLRNLSVASTAQVLLDATTRLNDPTGSKARLPEGEDWIILASDQDGNVYEAKLNQRPK